SYCNYKKNMVILKQGKEVINLFIIKDRKQDMWFKEFNEDLIKDKEFPVYTCDKKNATRFTKEEAEMLSSRIYNTFIEEVKR
ncbi:MAG: hypothetical protein ACRC7N_13685, partial [Clostridium sp.]